jgi:hypothetical protein
MNKQADIDWGTVLKLLAGGAITGAGLGAGTSFFRYLKSLRDQAATDTSADDNVLYLDLPPRPKPEISRQKWASSGTFAAGGLAGLLGTIMAYNAVRNIYQRSRKKQLQRELDSAQNIYVGGLSNQSDLEKGASQFSPLSKGVGTLYLAAVLTALGSGVVANKLLQKNFPPIRNPNLGRPKKIVVRNRTPDGEGDETVIPKGGVTPDAVESLVRTNMSFPKSAQADGFTADLVMAAAAGRCDEIRDNIVDFGLDAALDMVKGARHDEQSNIRKQLAVTWVCNDPLVSSAIEPVVASEFYDRAPGYCKLASYIPEEYHENLIGLTAASSAEVRAGVFKRLVATMPPNFVKAADSTNMAADMALSKALRTILGPSSMADALSYTLTAADRTQPGQDQQDTDMKTPGTQSNVPASEDSPILPDVELTDDEAKKFWDRYGRLIDNAVRKV